MEVYIIYDCNEWKNPSSFRFIMVSSIDKLPENMRDIQRLRGYTDDEMEKYIYSERVSIDEI